jgi:predicted lysophospholipase L1 biosynthesis ABC-type transport system permease subunit
MSGFLVIAAAVLIALLCRLAIERRASQFGLLMATGLSSRRSARVLLAEGGLVAVAGSAVGLPLGIGYAWFTVAMLRTRWAGAVGELDLSIHLDGGAVPGLAIGAVSGLVVSLLAMLWAARMLKRSRPLLLLAGWQTRGLEPRPAARRVSRAVAAGALCLGGACVIAALSTEALPEVPAFFAAGGLLLTGTLALALSLVLPSGGERKPRPLTLSRLAWRGASVNPVRSFLTVALLACASFVIVVVGANQRDVSRRDTRDPAAGAGGFDLMASCQLPVHEDLATAAGREALGFGAEEEELLARCRVVSMRVRPGEDASCLNMQRPRTPRVLGVPVEEMAETGFGLARTAPEGAGWDVLADAGTGYVPAAADASSAQWILKMALGDEVTVTGEDGADVRLRLAGMLEPGVFAAELLVGEDAFLEHFGGESGYRRFLIRTPAGEQDAVRGALVEQLGELGMTVDRTADILAGFARVQNTYLATFQTLGGLGLLLGTFGVVAVVLRAIVERRRELAVLQAVGLPRPRIAAMLALENVFLLALGVAVGTVAALVAVAPHLSEAEARADWGQLAGTLAICVLAGATSCALAAAVALRRELLPALRSE